MQVAEILRGVPLFAALEAEELEKVARLTTIKGVLAETPLFASGDPSECFYVVARGAVRVRLPPVAGAPAEEIVLGAGKFFGEMGVISGTPRNADAEAAEDAVLVRIGQDAFDQLMAVDPAISEKVMAAYLARAKEGEARESDAAASLEDPKCLLFFSPGGGSGATFLAANTAVKIRALTGRSVLLLDLDLETPAAHLFVGDATEGGDLAGLLAAGEPTSDAVRAAAKTLPGGIEFLGGPRPVDPAHAGEGALVALLHAAKGAYDYVVVDTHSAPSPRNQRLFGAADTVQLVFGPEIVSVSRAIATVRWFQAEGVDAKLRLVMNRFFRDGGLQPAALEERFGRPVLGRVEFEPDLAFAAVNEGVPLVTRSPESTAAIDLTRLARQVVSLGSGAETGQRPFSIWNLFGAGE